MVPFTCLSVEGHLAEVCTERPWLAIQICDHINEGVCPEHDLVLGFGIEQHALHQPQLRPHLQHLTVQYFTVQFVVLQLILSLLSNRMPFKFGTPACTIDMLTVATNSSKQTNNSPNNGLFFSFRTLSSKQYLLLCNYFSAWEHPQMRMLAE